jgi:large subunit ribosomal protein L18
MIKKVSRNEARVARHTRVRAKINGTKDIPRLNVFRSAKHITVQIIDDEAGNTLVSASSMDKDLKIKNGGNVEAAKIVGEAIAKKAKKAGITKVVFDRGGYQYHGRVEALANAARENGLEF